MVCCYTHVLVQRRDGDGFVSFEEFKRMNDRYPMVLFPAFKLQDTMQRCTLGESEAINQSELELQAESKARRA